MSLYWCMSLIGSSRLSESPRQNPEVLVTGPYNPADCTFSRTYRQLQLPGKPESSIRFTGIGRVKREFSPSPTLPSRQTQEHPSVAQMGYKALGRRGNVCYTAYSGTNDATRTRCHRLDDPGMEGGLPTMGRPELWSANQCRC